MRWAVAAAGAAVLLAGCRKPVHFPVHGMADIAAAAGARAAYDVNRDRKAEFFTYADAKGRINRIGYDNNQDGKVDQIVNLDEIDMKKRRHLVLILDGFAYDLVKEQYDKGRLRMFHPPSRVVAPYPTLTDLAIEDILGYVPCRGFEAMYFDRKANRLVGGQLAYMAGKNEPYNRLLNYRAGMIWDAIGYLWPWAVFGKEVNDLKRLFDRQETRELLAYLVSSACVSTRMGARGQKMCLRRVEQMLNQILMETRGLTHVTMLSDHGHSYTVASRIDLARHLTARGWRLTSRHKRPKDVVYIRFGLETYASFAADEAAALAADLIACNGVELASYAEKNCVVVLSPGAGRAVIRRSAGRLSYQPISGDPLKLQAVLKTLDAKTDGWYDQQELLAATATHEYPAPLQRLWRAHFALAENVPDVIVSLADRYYSGSPGFAMTGTIASTHGGLNYRNSVTFIMSTAGPLPPVMRSADIPGHMAKLLGEPWPIGK